MSFSHSWEQIHVPCHWNSMIGSCLRISNFLLNYSFIFIDVLILDVFFNYKNEILFYLCWNIINFGPISSKMQFFIFMLPVLKLFFFLFLDRYWFHPFLHIVFYFFHYWINFVFMLCRLQIRVLQISVAIQMYLIR